MNSKWRICVFALNRKECEKFRIQMRRILTIHLFGCLDYVRNVNKWKSRNGPKVSNAKWKMMIGERKWAVTELKSFRNKWQNCKVMWSAMWLLLLLSVVVLSCHDAMILWIWFCIGAWNRYVVCVIGGFFPILKQIMYYMTSEVKYKCFSMFLAFFFQCSIHFSSF